MFVPKLVTTLKDYNRQQFASDLTAGVIVGIVALPLAIAFGIASGGRDVSLPDSTGLRALRDVVRQGRAERTLVLIAEIHAQPLAALERSPTFEELGAGQIYVTLEDALDRAREHIATRTPTPIAPFPAVKR